MHVTFPLSRLEYEWEDLCVGVAVERGFSLYEDGQFAKADHPIFHVQRPDVISLAEFQPKIDQLELEIRRVMNAALVLDGQQALRRLRDIEAAMREAEGLADILEGLTSLDGTLDTDTETLAQMGHVAKALRSASQLGVTIWGWLT